MKPRRSDPDRYIEVDEGDGPVAGSSKVVGGSDGTLKVKQAESCSTCPTAQLEPITDGHGMAGGGDHAGPATLEAVAHQMRGPLPPIPPHPSMSPGLECHTPLMGSCPLPCPPAGAPLQGLPTPIPGQREPQQLLHPPLSMQGSEAAVWFENRELNC
ncbi:hypothetical protein M422DRAFT_272010 [Sphaerobolus stellatus SS14]|uniref:Uncharacterized protein n=1 Tax=Sphaerobolus stellatus (strain SS14) TaxID=990650 RepID=A0A0C9TCG5_SPHS4|nr:hypothetical protein M422DRAFT_272010 [Sphaerobolus stellatus SS14]